MDTNPLPEILSRLPKQFAPILAEPDKYRLQILYTQIDRDSNNQPSFSQYDFNLKMDEYFYPASSVKLAATALALEKLNDLNIAGLDKSSPLTIDSASAGQTAVTGDSSAASGKASIAHYIKKILLVSDNDAFNRLFEFVGQRDFNQRLWEKGMTDTKILRRLSVPGTPEMQQYGNPFNFYDGEKLIYQQPQSYNPDKMQVRMDGVKQGRGYMSGDKLIEESIDFSHSNYTPLPDLHGVLRRIIFPESYPPAQRFRLTDEDYLFLRRYLSMLPRESDDPKYPDSLTQIDGNAKTLMFGDRKEKIPPRIRIFSKSGGAYGYLIENAYIVDFKENVEFFLTAVIQVNDNQIYNDDTYEYDTVGKPFLAALGRAVYNFERNRKKEYPPDLSKFQRIHQSN